ncbi:SDR family oxidoreductase [Iodidimonas sp. SYSU 1G8]|uniref:SDR family oxidoreductase n=1 Tax=Iodidimonas sp. SYSU 1G8 TaxID=3133967 RepID=UPI0031FEA199
MSDIPIKTALVTGASARIGRAIALGLADAGWSVAIHYHLSGDAAQATAADVERRGVRAATVAADLSSEGDVSSLMARATDVLGPITCLVNNASVFERDDALTATRESWDRHLDTNLRAPFVLMQDLARMLPRGQRGNIINLIDQRVWRLTPAFTSYTLSKAALWTLTQTMAQALAPMVRVNAIAPGPTLPSPRQSAADFERQVAAIPLQINPSLEEFTRTVAFILEAGSFTGQMIALDGGQHLAWQTPDVVGVDE